MTQVGGIAGEQLRAFIRAYLRLVHDEPQAAEVLTIELRQSSKFMKEYENPQFADFLRMLGGIIAARRELLRRLRFENDYGVDIGLLIDALACRARIFEVDIGNLKHDSKPLEQLGEKNPSLSLF